MFQNLVRHVNDGASGIFADGALQGEGFQRPFDLPIVLLQNPELRLVFFIFPKLAFMTWTSYSTEPPGVAILTFRESGGWGAAPQEQHGGMGHRYGQEIALKLPQIQSDLSIVLCLCRSSLDFKAGVCDVYVPSASLFLYYILPHSIGLLNQ